MVCRILAFCEGSLFIRFSSRACAVTLTLTRFTSRTDLLLLLVRGVRVKSNIPSVPPLYSPLMLQPAEVSSGNLQEHKKESGEKDRRKKKGKEKKKENEKKGTYGLTKAEDKDPHRSAAHPQEPLGPSSKPHMLQTGSSQQPSTTMPGSVNSPTTAKAHSTSPPSGASSQGNLPVVVPQNATWEEVCQFALNSSILSGMFEDVRILACSRRSQVLARAGGVRALHANSALVRKALASSHLRTSTEVSFLPPPT